MTNPEAQVKDVSVDTSHGCILYIEGLTVSFDGFKALNDLNLYIDEGELRCIIGPNGAGKTTMMDVITGKTRPDKGTVFFGQNHDLSKMTEYEISHAGIGRKFQKPTVFLNHTVFENLELALKAEKNVWTSLTKSLSSEQKDLIEKDLEVNDIDILKKRLIYRSQYRGTKEMDKLIGSFVKNNIDDFNKAQLDELEKFLDIDDDTLYKLYNDQVIETDFIKSEIVILFKNFSYKK